MENKIDWTVLDRVAERADATKQILNKLGKQNERHVKALDWFESKIKKGKI